MTVPTFGGWTPPLSLTGTLPKQVTFSKKLQEDSSGSTSTTSTTLSSEISPHRPTNYSRQTSNSPIACSCGDNCELNENSRYNTDGFCNSAFENEKRRTSTLFDMNETSKILLENFKADMKSYHILLEELSGKYNTMRCKAPDGIRQKFDLAFNAIQHMTILQIRLNELMAEPNITMGKLASEFRRDEFYVYKKYTVMTANLGKEVKNNASYFATDIDKLETQIMIPANRINVYSSHFKKFLSNARIEQIKEIELTITFFETLKNLANTEMTINAIDKCPVELRLAGNIKNVGDFVCSGYNLKRKLYHVILFEDIFVITENKGKIYNYKCHLRRCQFVSVAEVKDASFTITISPNFQLDTATIKFKSANNVENLKWVEICRFWQDFNRSGPSRCAETCLFYHDFPIVNRFLPLSAYCLSADIRNAVDYVKNKKPMQGSFRKEKITEMFRILIQEEESYVNKLDVVLNPESMLPRYLGTCLKKIRMFHKNTFLPQLKKAYKNNKESVIDCFIGNLPNLPCIYKDYILVRSQLTLMLDDGEKLALYVSPFQQLAFYISWTYEIACCPCYHTKMNGQLCMLLNIVEQASAKMMKTAIQNCKIDRMIAGELILKGSLEVKEKDKLTKNSYTSYVLLFEKVLMFTKLDVPHYVFSRVIWLDQLMLGPNLDYLAFTIQERTKKKDALYELRADSSREKEEWVKNIMQLLNRFANDVKARISQDFIS